MTRYFVDKNGNYEGGYDGKNVKIPNGLIEVPKPPACAWYKWNGSMFIESGKEKSAEEKIRDQLRFLAIDMLINKGELPSDYKDKTV